MSPLIAVTVLPISRVPEVMLAQGNSPNPRIAGQDLAYQLSVLSKETLEDIDVIADHRRFRARLEDIRLRMLKQRVPGDGSAAAEWFLDNFYLLTETSQRLGVDMPTGFYRNLPAVTREECVRPRIYFIARHILEGSDVLDRAAVETFLIDFQKGVPLSNGELWGLPTMLRAVSLEKIVAALTGGPDPNGPSCAEESESAQGTVASAVRTLIVLKSMSWRQIFETCSLVHQELSHDPAGLYARMDSRTCDRYRSVVETLARRVGDSEIEVANAVVEIARSAQNSTRARECHVGYYLIDQGRPALEAKLGYRPTIREHIGRLVRRFATPIYLVLVGLATLFALAPVVALLFFVGAHPGVAVGALALAIIPASSFGIVWVQWVITQTIRPQSLPRLELEGGIPAASKTAVVIPTLLGDLDEVHHAIKQMERHYLANPDPNLCFALLADYVDANEARMPGDDELGEQAREGIEFLNRRYGACGVGPFHFLLRDRKWNARDKVWMGWERKRGKLEEFNRLLAGKIDTGYTVRVGEAKELEDIRFVITLDSDTQLPRDAARRLVAVFAHPLNQAEFSDGHVSSGYTVLQPRVDINPDASHRSRFSQVFAGDTGLDIYSRAVSDVYQDFFGAGVYVGKGIYDLNLFRRSLEGRAPENTLLSHDLFEGIHGRVGLVTDVVLYEDYPPNYLAFARRLHRWIRGDWQLLPWLASRVPGPRGTKVRSSIAHIDRWKVFDNLRRSLHPVALFGLFTGSWTMFPGSSFGWTALAVGFSSGPLLATIASRLLGSVRGGAWLRLGRVLADIPNDALRWLVALVSLPHEAIVVIDAIARTVARVFFTRRRLLEWTTAAHVAKRSTGSTQRALMWWEMFGGPLLSLSLVPVIVAVKPAALPVALPFLIAWLVSPEVALYLSRPAHYRSEGLSARDERRFRLLARRIWLFFEMSVGPEDQWLPPDNIQRNPDLQIAHRTSPTNIGLYLVSAATAYDLGFLDLNDLSLRLRNSFRTLAALERHRGQLLNWYDTRTLEALTPRYVSTVDNGNFAASLIALRHACSEYVAEPIFRKQAFAGLRDLISLIESSLHDLLPNEADTRRAAIDDVLRRIFSTLDSIGSPEVWSAALDEISHLNEQLLPLIKTQLVNEQTERRPDLRGEIFDWLDLLDQRIRSLQASMETLGGWFVELVAPPESLLLDRSVRSVVMKTIASCARIRLEQLPNAHSLFRELDEALRATGGTSQTVVAWREKIARKLARSTVRAEQLLKAVLDVGVQCEQEITRLDFGLLYDSEVHHFFIGYDVAAAQPDTHHYDLLASEARLASIIAIALGQVPAKHWFHLRRPLARLRGRTTLLSWSGTMFEYWMPPLFTRSFEKTLLGRSADVVIEQQMRYARRLKVPWGISESAFALCDKQGHYQYRAFGVPRLGLRRGLADDLVIAPYASILAVADYPQQVADNLEHLRQLGAWGEYGAFEAIDFTRGRRASDGTGAVVRAYMAHHQGMSLVSLGNLLAAGMPSRFHSDLRIQTAAHLLQERIPMRARQVELPADDHSLDIHVEGEAWWPWSPMAASPMDPQAHVLSNGKMSLQCDRFFRGGLWLGDVELRPWRESQDTGGFCLFLADDLSMESRVVAGSPEPTGANEHTVSYWPHKVRALSRFEGISIRQEVFLAGDDNVEIRRVTLINESDTDHKATLTAYADIAINHPGEHYRHPAFSRLFLETSVQNDGRFLLCRRRPRGPHEKWPVLAQACIGGETRDLSWETRRREFIGRGQSLRTPVACLSSDTQRAQRLRGGVGKVLDPCFAQRIAVDIAAGERQTIAWLTAAGTDEAHVMDALGRHSNLAGLSATLEHSEAHTRSRLRRLGMDQRERMTAQRVLARIQHSYRATGRLDRRRLWGHGISGDHRLLLFHWRSQVAQYLNPLLKMQALWKEQRVPVEVAIFLHDAPSYVDGAREQVGHLARALGLTELDNELVVISAGHLSLPDLAAFEAAASFVIDDQHGSIEDHLDRAQVAPKSLPLLAPAHPERDEPRTEAIPRPTGLLFDNGLGGFAADGKTYRIYLPSGSHTPAPWCNVLANPRFGCLVSERGLGSTWAINASENRLTSWSNDPVSDPPAEVLYLRDEDTGAFWSATPAPCGADTPYVVEHGLGSTRFGHHSHNMEQWVRVLVDPENPVKLVELSLRNLSDRPRRLSVTYYAEWVLGTRVSQCSRFARQVADVDARALFVRNPWLLDNPEQMAFLASTNQIHGFTTDREEFLGLGGLVAPDALCRRGLSNSEVPVAQPCGVLQIYVDLPANQTVSLHFALGWGADEDAARRLAASSTEPAALERMAAMVFQRWQDILGAVHVETPEPSMDLMLNAWAIYQTVSSRLFARAGFYQCSGAFGFRDQLQDVMALCYGAPHLARTQILNSAAHQFSAGDVLHWWHPPSDRGVRTRCSDDLVWLPYVVAYYVRTTGDVSILEEQAAFLHAPELDSQEDEKYGLFEQSSERGTLAEHCHRALERAFRLGEHGLPLIGGGDWNDGMNRVGAEGRGESVWLGWFLFATLHCFAKTCERVGDFQEAARLRAMGTKIEGALARAWDGSWYLRAYYDDGTPLGAHTSTEARIDSISQSWSVLSGAKGRERAATAVASAFEQLVDKKAGLARLLWPPFDRDPQDPGYIKGYPPGIRENGAQYTHAATWLVWALADIGCVDESEALFRMLNPIEHCRTAEDTARYRVEPYVLAGDVYSIGPHRGTGGWSWYTGSAGWYWRVGIEALLGISIDWPYLTINPKIPATWPHFRASVCLPGGTYELSVRNPDGVYDRVISTTLNGYKLPDPRIHLEQSAGGSVEVLLG